MKKSRKLLAAGLALIVALTVPSMAFAADEVVDDTIFGIQTTDEDIDDIANGIAQGEVTVPLYVTMLAGSGTELLVPDASHDNDQVYGVTNNSENFDVKIKELNVQNRGWTLVPTAPDAANEVNFQLGGMDLIAGDYTYHGHLTGLTAAGELGQVYPKKTGATATPTYIELAGSVWGAPKSARPTELDAFQVIYTFGIWLDDVNGGSGDFLDAELYVGDSFAQAGYTTAPTVNPIT